MRGRKKKAAKEKKWKCYSRNSILYTTRCPDCGQLIAKYEECKRCKKLGKPGASTRDAGVR